MPSTVRKGDLGEDVVRCQERLTVHGYPCSADGDFGAGTFKAVKAFQKAAKVTADGIVGPHTWSLLLADTAPERDAPMPLPGVLVHLQSLGHKIMCEGNYHLNLFGIRSSNKVANAFDDTMGCAYLVNGMWRVHYWPATTDPGTHYLENKAKWYGPAGVAILAPGQYVDTYKIDLHGGSKYEALCQRNGPVKIYRDNDLDNKLDFDEASLKDGQWIGINLHASTSHPYSTGVDKTKVGPWSAGCQVHATVHGFLDMMQLAHLQVEHLKRDTFTYTLMDQWF
jgi:hypothetical protein